MHSLKYTVPFLFVVPIFVTHCHSLSFVVTRCHSLSLLVTRYTTRCHSLYHSLQFVVTLCTTRCHSFYHSLSLVLPLVVTRCHSLSIVVILCTTRPSFYKRSLHHARNSNKPFFIRLSKFNFVAPIILILTTKFTKFWLPLSSTTCLNCVSQYGFLSLLSELYEFAYI